MRCFLSWSVGVSFLLGIWVIPSWAGVPQTVSFQGKLSDSEGQPMEGPTGVTFRLYNSATGGTKLWEETKSLTVSDGLFSTLLGGTVPLTLPFDQPYWVEIQIGSETLSPRQPLSSSPYALRAQRLDGIHVVNGKVGIGTSNPATQLEVNGSFRLTPAGAPSNPTAGTLYFGATTKHFYGFDGTRWKRLDD